MKKIFAVLVVFGALNFYSSNAFSKELKIAYVDIFGLFNDYEKTKEYDKTLEEKKTTKEKDLDVEKKKIEGMQNKLSVLKDKEQTKQQEEISKAVKDFRKLERDVFVDLKKERDEKMKEIVDDINKVIKDYAKEKGFDYVINANAILYGDETMDITAEILKLVNKKYKK